MSAVAVAHVEPWVPPGFPDVATWLDSIQQWLTLQGVEWRIDSSPVGAYYLMAMDEQGVLAALLCRDHPDRPWEPYVIQVTGNHTVRTTDGMRALSVAKLMSRLAGMPAGRPKDARWQV